MRDHTIPMVDLKRQYELTREAVEPAISRVLKSGRYISGPETEAFEREYAASCGVSHCVAVGSGTAALNLTLKALGLKAGDEVVTVGFTISATLDAICDLGARPVLVDIELESYTLDPSLLELAITSQTKAILPVHIYGHPANMDPILEIGRRYQLPVVSDACEAHGGLYHGMPIESFGTASCTSFYPTKNLGSFGDAGAVLTNDSRLANDLKRLRYHGWERRFHSTVTSMNSRMDEIQAAVLRAKLPRLEDWNRRRRDIAERYDAALSSAGLKKAPKADWASPAYYLYVAASRFREQFRSHLATAEIDTDIHWPSPPHLQPAFAHLGYGEGSLPLTEQLCREVVSLPMFAELTRDEVDSVCEKIKGFPA